LADAAEVKSLWKSFGSTIALSQLSFRVREGEVFGLIGPNGAGKTTCFRILSTILRPDRGEAYVFGKDVVSEAGEVRRLISYLPEEAGVYRNLTGLDFLKLTATTYGVDGQKLSEAIAISGLGENIRLRMGTYSKGMRRRILVTRALMTRPKLAIMDEPTSGLDVEHAVYIRDVIKEYAAERGVTFLISSHNMLEISYICSRVAFIHRSRIIAEGEPQELLEKHGAPNLEELFLRIKG